MLAGTLTHRKKMSFTRDLGWKPTPDGRRIQPRFLLGHDRAMAEPADAKLTVLWEKVVKHIETRNRHLAAAPDALTTVKVKGSSNLTRSKRTRIKTPPPAAAGVSEVHEA